MFWVDIRCVCFHSYLDSLFSIPDFLLVSNFDVIQRIEHWKVSNFVAEMTVVFYVSGANITLVVAAPGAAHYIASICLDESGPACRMIAAAH